ncbi:unnamed protein product [Oikopleura dioica]|uniref:Ubiquitin-like domain-containing protein n=1 Tax=Oikopleura dioica TaxID=34765 RepID=E4YRH2_OIKDI|nr:unnamed protein product [Oikopleura dioica]
MKRALDETRGLFTFTLIYAGEKIRVAFKRDENIGILKERVAVAVREKGHVEIPISRMKLLHKSAILQPDSSPVYWIAGIGPDCEIILVENNPTVNIYRSVAQIPETSACNITESFLQQAFNNRAMEDAGESMSQTVEEFDEDPEKEEIAKRINLMR